MSLTRIRCLYPIHYPHQSKGLSINDVYYSEWVGEVQPTVTRQSVGIANRTMGEGAPMPTYDLLSLIVGPRIGILYYVHIHILSVSNNCFTIFVNTGS